MHIYSLKKFQKIQKFIAFTTTYPKSLNSIYGIHNSLGVNYAKKKYVYGMTAIYSFHPIILDTFEKNKNTKEFERNLQKFPTKTKSNFVSTFQ
jgi:hypothetical protein